MLLSILTPAIWSRLDKAEALKNKIEDQISRARISRTPPPVEHLVLLDTKTRSVGIKRQALLDAARGKYIAFVDDDDDISPDYVAEIIRAITYAQTDVITFKQEAIVNGVSGLCSFGLGQPDEAFSPSGFLRNAWHVCAWRRDLVKDCLFPDNSYGEDLTWSLQARFRARTSHHIDKVLHTYRHDLATTAAPPPSAL